MSKDKKHYDWPDEAKDEYGNYKHGKGSTWHKCRLIELEHDISIKNAKVIADRKQAELMWWVVAVVAFVSYLIWWQVPAI